MRLPRKLLLVVFSDLVGESDMLCARDIQAVCTDMEGIQRKHWPLRFVRARQYSSRLDRLVKSLAEADAVFTASPSLSV